MVSKEELNKMPAMDRFEALKKSNTSGKKVKKKGIKSNLQKKKDNPNSKYWKDKAMKMWGKFQHHTKRACIICGRTRDETKLDAHHLIGRANVLFRNHPDNCAMLCVPHHKYDTVISAHMGQLGFIKHLKENYPDMIRFIEENQHKTGKPNYKEEYELLKELFEDYGGVL